MGDGEVNNQILNTLLTKPEDFWYLNNGVTGICSSFSKTPLGGGDNRQAGAFVFHGIQFVNGAQTIGSIIKAYAKAPEKVAKSFVHFKVISMEGTPLGFTDTITIATNKQNKVEEKDFLTLDPDQGRLKVELLAQGIQYVFRSGEVVIDSRKGFDVTEAMIALACASSDVGNAVLAKRNIGLLLDKKSAAYQAVFNSSTKGDLVWSLVQLTRQFDHALQNTQSNASSQRKKQILTHGNRILLWLYLNTKSDYHIDNSKELIIFIDITSDLIDEYMKKHHPDSYLAVFFKNTQKCSTLVGSVSQALNKNAVKT